MALKGVNLGFVTGRLIDEINDFLSSFSLRIPMEPVSKGNGANVELRNQVRTILNKLPHLDEEYSLNRTNQERKYITYSPFANDFKAFRLTNFKGSLNDRTELEWFRNYAGRVTLSPASSLVASVFPLVKSLREDGNMLLKCTTTTFNNQKYMVGNYCAILNNPLVFCPIDPDYSKQFAAIFDSREIDNKFDSYRSTKIIPIRGFVRYDEFGKRDAIKELNKLIKAKGISYPPVVFIAIILSTFIKGKCMSEEAEYRFIMINKFEFTELLDIEAQVDHASFSFHSTDLSKNPFYCGHECGDENTYLD